jgi:hypothetical protein
VAGASDFPLKGGTAIELLSQYVAAAAWPARLRTKEVFTELASGGFPTDHV